MIEEEDILTALDKPLAVYSLKQRVDPGSRNTDALQELLMRMRSAGKVKFNLNSGRWSRS